jgi:hypothetical protein
MDFRFFTPRKSPPPSTDFIAGYKSGVEDEYQRCQQEHQQILDNIWKFCGQQLGPRKLLELQRKYAAENPPPQP